MGAGGQGVGLCRRIQDQIPGGEDGAVAIAPVDGDGVAVACVYINKAAVEGQEAALIEGGDTGGEGEGGGGVVHRHHIHQHINHADAAVAIAHLHIKAGGLVEVCGGGKDEGLAGQTVGVGAEGQGARADGRRR